MRVVILGVYHIISSRSVPLQDYESKITRQSNV
jgi:hypothetical protein